MNIQEASALAGYNSPANFSTAFKRRFGVAPRSVLRTNRGG
ncbi:helix-turn-helix domain-containing protein [Rhizobium sullae]|nr:AraC family transcriptional regulator [Rhizobium sullae]